MLLTTPGALAEGPAAAVSPVSTAGGRHSLRVGGVERSYLLDVPADLRPGSALVLVFHGFTGSADAIRADAGFTSLAGERGFVVAYPQGSRDAEGRTHFNVGYAFHEGGVDDVAFVRELVRRLVRDLGLDPRSVFCTGMSNGGDMSYLLGWRPDSFVRAIAPVAGTMMASWGGGTGVGEASRAAGRVSVMAVNGTADSTTLWAGDMENRDGWGAYLGIDAVMERWVRRLTLEEISRTDLPAGPQGGKAVRRHRWGTSADDTEVLLYEIRGGGHDWPSGLGHPDRSTAREIWDFFERHRPVPDPKAPPGGGGAASPDRPQTGRPDPF